MAETTQHDDVVEVLRARRIEIIDEAGAKRIHLGVDVDRLATIRLQDWYNSDAFISLNAGYPGEYEPDAERVGVWLESGRREYPSSDGVDLALIRRIKELEQTVKWLAEGMAAAGSVFTTVTSNHD